MANTVASETEGRQGFDFARLDESLVKVTQRLAMLAVVSVLLIAFANVGDIICRNFLGFSFYGLNEINILLVAIAISSCLPSGMSRRVALTITLAEKVFGNNAGAWFRVFGHMAMVLFFGLLAWRLGRTAYDTGLYNQTTIMTLIPKAPFLYAVTFMIAAGTLVEAVVTARSAQEAWKLTPRSGGLILAALLAFYAALALLLTGTVRTGVFMSVVPANPLLFAGLAFAAMWVIILAMVPLGPALGITGLVGTMAILGLGPALEVLGAESKSFISREALSVLPLFLLMGTFSSVAGIGGDLYRLAYMLVGHLRGGLAQATIAACAGFGSLTGSAVATQMAIGRIAMPEMRSRGYSAELTAGTIAAGGTLGQLIPPSGALIFYAVMTEESVGRLFIGALLPGLLGALLYMGTVRVWLFFHPGDGRPGERTSRGEIAGVLRATWAPILLLVVVLGGIYAGLFTDLEAGSVGAAGAFLIAVARGRINRNSFWEVMAESTHTMALIYTLLFGTVMLSYFFGISNLPEAFLAFVQGLGLSPLGVVVALVLCYLLLGTAMDSWAMMVITIPIFVPLVVGVGFDPIWWGVMTIICMEAGQISPPFGINIFLINALAPDMPLTRVFAGCWPFFWSTCVKIAILIAFPAIVTFLPKGM